MAGPAPPGREGPGHGAAFLVAASCPSNNVDDGEDEEDPSHAAASRVRVPYTVCCRIGLSSLYQSLAATGRLPKVRRSCDSQAAAR